MSDTSALKSLFPDGLPLSDAVQQSLETGDFRRIHKRLISGLRKPARRVRKTSAGLLSLLRADTLCRDDADEAWAAEMAALAVPEVSSGSKSSRRSARRAEELGGLLAVQLETQSEQVRPLTVLVAAEHLLRHVRQMSAETSCRLAALLAALRGDRLVPPLPRQPQSIAAMTDYVVCSAEIPFVLGLVTGPLLKSSGGRRRPLKILAECLDEGTDTDGTPHAACLRDLDGWLQPFMRTAVWAAAFEVEWLKGVAAKRWRAAADRAAVLADAGHAGEFAHPQWPAALQTLRVIQKVTGADNASVCRNLLRSWKRVVRKDCPAVPPSKSERRATIGSGRVCLESDWAGLAAMRSGTTVASDSCVLTWEAGPCSLRIAPFGRTLLSGEWSTAVSFNGAVADEEKGWNCVCWFEDKDAAYAELQQTSSSGLVRTRQITLCLRDHLAVVSESVASDDDSADVSVVSSLPLGNSVGWECDAVTRELWLHTPQFAVRAIPAWMRDDRIDFDPGSFQPEDDRLIWKAQGRGGVTAPLVLDWHPDRRRQPADWSRVTVTTTPRKVCSPGEANAFRIRVGKRQIVLFHALRAPGTLRSFLGMHTAHETVIGRFCSDGDIAPLVIVDGAD